VTESQTTPTEDAGTLTWVGGSNAPAPAPQPEPATTWADAVWAWSDVAYRLVPYVGFALILVATGWAASL